MLYLDFSREAGEWLLGRGGGLTPAGDDLLLGAEVVAYPIATKRWFVVVQALTSWTAQIEYYSLRLFTSAASLEGMSAGQSGSGEPGGAVLRRGHTGVDAS